MNLVVWLCLWPLSVSIVNFVESKIPGYTPPSLLEKRVLSIIYLITWITVSIFLISNP